MITLLIHMAEGNIPDGLKQTVGKPSGQVTD